MFIIGKLNTVVLIETQRLVGYVVSSYMQLNLVMYICLLLLIGSTLIICSMASTFIDMSLLGTSKANVGTRHMDICNNCIKCM